MSTLCHKTPLLASYIIYGNALDDDKDTVESLIANFESTLATEFKKLFIFHVPQEGVYNVAVLLTNATEALSSASRSKLPKSGLDDFNEGGRCLACDFNTAAGFHLLRAVERALRAYFKLVTGRNADQHRLDWGTCIQELKKTQRSDPKVIGVLDQIRAIHRNPLMHPEVFLDGKEAKGIFRMAASAIDAMTQFFP